MTGYDEAYPAGEHPFRSAWSAGFVAQLNKRGFLFRVPSRSIRTRSTRLRDAWVWSGGFVAGVLASAAVAVIAVGAKVLT